MTFRLEVFIADKNLGEALIALSQIRGVEIQGCPQPVVNRAKGGKPIAGSRAELARKILDQMPTPFAIALLKTQFKTILGVNDPTYYIQRWKREKLIKLKHRGIWQKLPHKIASGA